jgi:hypothetical protein
MESKELMIKYNGDKNFHKLSKNVLSYLIEFNAFCDLPKLMTVCKSFRKTIQYFVKNKVFLYL